MYSNQHFAIFPSPEWGIRALGKLLLNYEKIHGISTVSGIISRYAPTNENNTDAYIDAVCDELSVFSHWPISVEKRLPELVKAIIKHENGLQPYSDDLIDRGLNMIG